MTRIAARRGNGEGSIRQRADGRWEGQRMIAGRRYSRYGKTRQEVQRALAQLQRDFERGQPLSEDRQTVATFLRSWLDAIAPTLESGTLRRHRDYCDLHIIPALGKHRLARLTPQQVQALYAQKLAEGLSSTTVNGLHRTLHKALGSAVRLGLTQRNVSDLVEVPKIRQTELRTLSGPEARRFLRCVREQESRFEALYAVALATGLREGELLALRWEDVDLEARTLRVVRTLKHDETARVWVFGAPKTKRSRRQVTLPTPAVEALKRQRTAQNAQRLKMGELWVDQDLVFCTSLGTHLLPQNLLRVFWRDLETAGVPRLRFHDLRHTCATLLLAAGVNAKVVSELLGHASVAFTLQTYAHVLPDMQERAAHTMASVLAVG